jgi:hypothetical protein
MAKVGEGDARWIVAERQDGTNVNQWHWCAMRAMRRSAAPRRALAHTHCAHDTRVVAAHTFRVLLQCADAWQPGVVLPRGCAP